MAKRGRPTSYTLAIAEEICTRLVNGEYLIHICADSHIPSMSTVGAWAIDHPDFSAMYARAREIRAELDIDEIKALSDNTGLTKEEIDKARLQIDTRKWAAAKRRPRVYGDKLDLNHSGGITVQITEREAKL